MEMLKSAMAFYEVKNLYRLFDAVENTAPYKEWAAYHKLDGWRGIFPYLNLFFANEVNGFERILVDPFVHYHCNLRYESDRKDTVEVISRDTMEGFPTICCCSLDGLSEGQLEEIGRIIEPCPDYSIFPEDVIDEDGELLVDVQLELADRFSIVEKLDPERLIKPLGITVTQFRFSDISGDDLLRVVDWEVDNKNDFLNIDNWI